MSDDFEGRVHDLEAADQEERSDGEEEKEEELDKQMGEVDGDDTDKLDEQMWGSDGEQGEEQGVRSKVLEGQSSQSSFGDLFFIIIKCTNSILFTG